MVAVPDAPPLGVVVPVVDAELVAVVDAVVPMVLEVSDEVVVLVEGAAVNAK